MNDRDEMATRFAASMITACYDDDDYFDPNKKFVNMYLGKIVASRAYAMADFMLAEKALRGDK